MMLVINFCAITKLGLVNISQHDKIFIKQQNKWDINNEEKI